MSMNEMNCSSIEETCVSPDLTHHEDLHDSSNTPDVSMVEGLVIGKVVGFLGGLPNVMFEITGSLYVQVAFAVVGEVKELQIDSLVCLTFDQQRCDRPIVLGKMHSTDTERLSRSGGTVIADSNQITIQCGKACIRLSADGTVAIRGTNVASRATHTNRIRGGNVQIN